jgi:7-carboxy-7-deazaguanine synthase
MLISEIYRSRQGEGFLTGTNSVFVRTSGCNLRCGFCDTPFASWDPEGDQLSIAEIIDQVQVVGDSARHIVLTGGEPMLPREIVELCQQLQALEFHLTIETAGTIYRELACDLMSISPKLINSDPESSRAGDWLEKHRTRRHRPDVVRQLLEKYEYQLKFVVESPDDIDEIKDYLRELNAAKPERVLLMPQGTTTDQLERRAQWLIPVCEEHGFIYCPRRHIEWYGNKRGT